MKVRVGGVIEGAADAHDELRGKARDIRRQEKAVVLGDGRQNVSAGLRPPEATHMLTDNPTS